MSWTRTERTDRLTEWRRADGGATVRLRERATGGFVVRLDVLEQASEESVYERETASDRAAAVEIAERFRDAHALDGE